MSLHFMYFAVLGVVPVLPKFPEPPRHTVPVSLAGFTDFLESKATGLQPHIPISPQAPKAKLAP